MREATGGTMSKETNTSKETSADFGNDKRRRLPTLARNDRLYRQARVQPGVSGHRKGKEVRKAPEEVAGRSAARR